MAKTSKRIAFIINPVSGTNNKSNIKKKISEFFESKNFEIEILTTKRPGDAKRFAGQFVRENFDAVVAVGGDGTVNEVVNGIHGSKIAFGIIPSGSGNGFARHIKIPLNAEGSLKTIEEFITTDVDVMNINNNISANVSGIGFDALVAKKFHNSTTRGLKTYIKIIFAEFLSYKNQNYNIIIDDQEIERYAFLISFANSSQFGNNAYISPEASISDGKIDLCIIKKFSFFGALSLGIKLMTKTLHKSKYIEIIRAKEIEIKQKDDFCHLDGDFINCGNSLDIKIIPGAINMIIPQTSKNKI